jgi:hypothetical protein
MLHRSCRTHHPWLVNAARTRYERILRQQLLAALSDAPVVLLNSDRQPGSGLSKRYSEPAASLKRFHIRDDDRFDPLARREARAGVRVAGPGRFIRVEKNDRVIGKLGEKPGRSAIGVASHQNLRRALSVQLREQQPFFDEKRFPKAMALSLRKIEEMGTDPKKRGYGWTI